MSSHVAASSNEISMPASSEEPCQAYRVMSVVVSGGSDWVYGLNLRSVRAFNSTTAAARVPGRGRSNRLTAMTPSTISRDELREMLEALHDTAAARGEIDIVVQCRRFLEELDRRGDRSVIGAEMIAKLRQTYVDFCRQRRQ